MIFRSEYERDRGWASRQLLAWILAAVLLTSVAIGEPALAETQSLAALTTFVATGTADTIVELPAPAELNVREPPPWEGIGSVDFRTSGSHAGILIEHLAPNSSVPALPRRAFLALWVPKEDRCAGDFCVSNVIYAPLLDGYGGTLEMPAGSYRITVTAPPAQEVEVDLRLEGLTGEATVQITEPSSRWRVTRITDSVDSIAIARTHEGGATGTLDEAGAGVLVSWMLMRQGATVDGYTCSGAPDGDRFHEDGTCNKDRANRYRAPMVAGAGSVRTLMTFCWVHAGCAGSNRLAYRYEAYAPDTRAFGFGMWLDLTQP